MKKAMIILLFAGSTVAGYAQGGNNPLGSQDQMTIMKEFETSLGDMDKPEIQPPAATVKVNTDNVTYDEKDIKLKTEFTPPSIKTSQPRKWEVAPLFNNFVKAGFGRFSTPLLKVYLNNGYDDDTDVGLDFTHHNSFSGHVDYGEFREDYGNLKASYALRNHTMNARLGVYNTDYFYYADTMVTDHPELKDSIRHGFTRIAFDAGIRKPVKTETPGYEVGLQFRSYFDQNKTSDLHFSVLPGLEWGITKDLSASLRGNLTFSNTKADSITQTRFFLDFTPTGTLKLGKLAMNAGLKINSYSDSSGKFRAYPVAKVMYEVVPGHFTVLGGLQGEMHYNQYFRMMEVNRYLGASQDIRPSSEKIQFFAGIEGSFAKYVNFTLRLSHKKVEDQMIFYNPYEGAYFTPVYDSLFVQNTAAFGLNFNKADKLKAGIQGEIRKFTTSTVAYNFNVPETQFDFWASYNLAKKAWVRLDLFFFGDRVMSVDTLGEPIRENTTASLNLAFDYRFSERISVFLELNNLLNSSYYRWYNYLERPLDIKAGATFSF